MDSIIKRIKRFLFHFRKGVKYKIPLCCIIAFCLNRTSKGIIMRNQDLKDVWVPCPIHKRFALSNRQFLLLANEGELPLDENSFDENGMYMIVGVEE